MAIDIKKIMERAEADGLAFVQNTLKPLLKDEAESLQAFVKVWYPDLKKWKAEQLSGDPGAALMLENLKAQLEMKIAEAGIVAGDMVLSTIDAAIAEIEKYAPVVLSAVLSSL